MGIVDAATLKSYFETGDIPTESQFIDLVDTIMNDLASKPKMYVAIMTQAGAAAPVATVILNTLSAPPVWSRSGAGDYFLTLASEFTAGKTTVVLGGERPQEGFVVVFPSYPNAIEVFSSGTATPGVGADDLISTMSIIVAVYP